MTLKEAQKLIALLKKYPCSSNTMHDFTREDVLKYMEAQAIITAAETEKRVRGEMLDKLNVLTTDQKYYEGPCMDIIIPIIRCLKSDNPNL